MSDAVYLATQRLSKPADLTQHGSRHSYGSLHEQLSVTENQSQGPRRGRVGYGRAESADQRLLDAITQ